MTHEGSYPDLPEAQWRQQLFGFFEAILRTTDLREIVLALQKIAREGHLYEMVSQTIESQKISRHYFGDGSTLPHIMTGWDQLEELLQDGNFVYAPVGGHELAFHVAVAFQQLIVKSTDVKVIEFLGKRGLTLTSIGQKPNPLFINEWTHFKNMTQNYGALDDIAKVGQLRIFQILYSGLMNSTPTEYKNSADVNLNHMAGLFHLNNIGFFEQTTMAMASMQSQGKLQYFINNLLGVIQLLDAEDINSLKQVIYNLVSRAKAGDMAPLDMILDRLETAQNNNEGYQSIKDTLFHIFPAVNQVNVQPTGLLRAIVAITDRPKAFKKTLDNVMSDAEVSDGYALTVAANILRLNPTGLGSLKSLGETLFLNDNEGINPLGSAVSLMSDLYLKHPDEFSQIHKALVDYSNDPKLKP